MKRITLILAGYSIDCWPKEFDACYPGSDSSVVNTQQELIACGSANIVGSFFSCFPVSGSLSRSVIQESIARTQVRLFLLLIVLISSNPCRVFL